MFGIALNYPLPYWKVLPGTPVSTELSVLYPGYEPYRSQMEFSQRKEQDGEYVSIPDVTEVDIQLVPMQDGS